MFCLVNFVLGLSQDCPNMIFLARGLNMHITNVGLYNMVVSDCCSATGVSCDGTPRVTIINWSSSSLTGFLNTSALPSNLILLSLNDNSVGGPFPKNLPIALEELYLTGNNFNGVIPSNLPTTLLYLFLNDNFVTGNLPSVLPPQLYQIGATLNQLNGTLPVALPSSRLFGVYLQNNYFTGPIPTIPNGMRDLDLYYNFLSGVVPVFPMSLRNLKIQGNALSGIVYLSAVPTYNAILNDNLFTGVIIYVISSIQICDISNNPLLGSPSISNLTICTQTGLFKIVQSSTIVSSKKSTTLISTEKSTTSSVGTPKTSTTSISLAIVPKISVSTVGSIILNSSISSAIDTFASVADTFLVSNTRLASILNIQSMNNTSPTHLNITSMPHLSTSLIYQNGPASAIIQLNLRFMAVVRIVINAMILSSIVTKMPLSRHFKATKGKRKQEPTFGV